MAFKFPWQKLRERREHFRESRRHSPESDFDFIQQATPTANKAQREWAVILREFTSELCGVPREYLHSTDLPEDIQKLLGPATAKEFFLEVPLEIVQQMDSSEFLIALEKRISISGRHELKLYGNVEFEKVATRRWIESSNLGEWIAWLATEIESRVGRPSPPAAEDEGNNE